MSGIKKRLRELEADNARLREKLHEAMDALDVRERYWRERMARYGAPHVHRVYSPEDDFILMHAITRVIPTPDGLQIEIERVGRGK